MVVVQDMMAPIGKQKSPPDSRDPWFTLLGSGRCTRGVNTAEEISLSTTGQLRNVKSTEN